jgi:pimeloyl-ACP methyl ester carboxylesterase
MIHHEVEGEGFPVVLHTGGGGDLRMWRIAGYVDGLDGYRFVLVDHRGRGRTPPAESYAPAAMANDVLEVADSLELDRFAFWGYSMGSYVGYELAATESTRVAALVGSGGVDSPDGDPSEWRETAAAVRAGGVRSILGDEPAPDWLLDHLCETDDEVFARSCEDFAHWSPWQLFPRIDAPTLIVAGELEATNVPAAAAALPHGEAEILPGLGHIGAWLAVDQVVPRVRRFLAEALP